MIKASQTGDALRPMNWEGEKIDVLVVEDDPCDSDLSNHAMVERKFAPAMHLVRDGIEALDFLYARGEYQRRNPAHLPRLILMDVHLPKLSGPELLKALRADDRFRSVPIVMFSGSSMESDVRECYDLGAQAFVTKPVDFREYSEKLGTIANFWLRVVEPRPLEAA